MTTYLEKGDKLKGEKIRCEARKIKKIKPSPKTGRHKIQRAILKNNAECEIEIETEQKKKNKRKLSFIFSFFFNSVSNAV